MNPLAVSESFSPAETLREERAMDPAYQRRCWILLGVLLAVLGYVYGNTLWAVSDVWNSDQYSHGWLIPLFAVFLVWARRKPFVEPRVGELWLGVGLIALATAARVLASYYVQFTVDNISLIPCLLGVFLLVGGVPALRWAGPGVVFLLFMYPLPGFLVDNILRPLQTLATMTSVYALQTCGVEVFREGNIMHLEQVKMGVVDQCSGLRMLTIFMALAMALALIWRERPLWERIAIFLSSIPIALLVNCIRITITGLLFNLNVRSEIANAVFHDLAGWVMMPMAFGFLVLVSWLVSRVIIEEEIAPHQAMGKGVHMGGLGNV